MGYSSNFEEKVRRDFAKRISDHIVTERRIDGLYRHWRCAKPGTGVDSFSIITWPGYLCYTGDMGEYLFSRTDDMVAFMRGASKDFRYAAEKCIASGRDGIREFRVELVGESLDEILAESYPDESPKTAEAVEGLRESIIGDELAPDEVRRLISDSGMFDGCDMPRFEAFTFRFLWCMNAINWFCGKVDEKCSS